MRKSKFTDSQIMEAVKRVEAGFAVPDICRELGISSATFHQWRAKCGGVDVSMMARMTVTSPISPTNQSERGSGSDPAPPPPPTYPQMLACAGPGKLRSSSTS